MSVLSVKHLAVVLLCLVVYWINGWINSVNINEYYKGKRIVLTGASKGIGKELAIQLARAGAEIFISARSKDLLESTADLCEREGGRVHTMVGDVGREKDCRGLAEEAIAVMGGVDMLILNAAYSPEPLFLNETDDWDTKFTNVFRVNLFQSVNIVQYLLPSLISTRGHIVAVSSGASFLGMPRVVPYSSTKHALNGFFKGLRQELTLQNIPVDITIMPLPFVLTEKAVTNWRPTSASTGITAEDCAVSMVHTMPSRKSWIFVDWSSYFMSLISSVFPDFTDFCVRIYVGQTSLLFQ